jgi:acetyltransferase-like isoleucine patch superfamily enzyme
MTTLRETKTRGGLRAIAGSIARVPWRLQLVNALLAPLPIGVASPYRARLYRLAGLRGVATDGVYVEGTLDIFGEGEIYSDLRVGPRTTFGARCKIELGGRVEIGVGVTICHDVSIMTISHAIGPPAHRAGTTSYRDVRIEDGVWIGAHVVICPGVTIGRGSVLTSGSVVMRDVPPDSLVQGSSARVVRRLDGSDEAAIGMKTAEELVELPAQAMKARNGAH